MVKDEDPVIINVDSDSNSDSELGSQQSDQQQSEVAEEDFVVDDDDEFEAQQLPRECS